MTVPFVDLTAHRRFIGGEIDRAIAAVVEHGRWILGPEVTELESALATSVGNQAVQAITCGNGTDALVLAMQALELPRGYGVVCPAFTFVATAESILLAGGVPIFADVEYESYNLDPASVAKAAEVAREAGIKVAGVISVDLFGRPADYKGIRDVVADRDWWLIADAAQAFGAETAGAKVGDLADLTTTSFFPAKPLGCYGDGGALFTRDAALADRLRSLRVHGKGTSKYDNIRIGQNSRLDTVQAAVLLAKLQIFDEEVKNRAEAAERYHVALNDIVETPVPDGAVRSAWAQYTIRSDHRAALQQQLTEDGIGSAVYYETLLPDQPAYRAYRALSADLSTSSQLASKVLSIPIHPYLAAHDQERVIASIRAATTRATG